MFERLSEKLESVFKKLRGHGAISPELLKATLREIRLALLEADVNYKVAKELERRIEERAAGAEVAASLTPAQQVIKIVRDELTAILGGTARADPVRAAARGDADHARRPPGQRQDHLGREAGAAPDEGGQAPAADRRGRLPPRRPGPAAHARRADRRAGLRRARPLAGRAGAHGA